MVAQVERSAQAASLKVASGPRVIHLRTTTVIQNGQTVQFSMADLPFPVLPIKMQDRSLDAT
jgi:hypothetical protein